ncbi:Zinc fingerMIZ-type [Penicillium sp. IBT 31633x]|nr:Zinc fingerMIZ-type [Penicillium sp. IBT 31633x]
MVSPKSHRSHTSDHIGESNNTAKLFLGGVRRNWMDPQTRPENSGRPRNLPHVDLPDNVPGSLRELSLMSPVTPGETVQNQPCSRAHAVHAKHPNKQAAALPSPVLSTTSHPSPASADVIVANPTPQISTQLTVQRGGDERMAVQPPPTSGLVVEQRATQSPLVVNNWSQTNSPADTSTQENGVTGPRPGSQAQKLDAPVIISNETWKQWSLDLDSLIADFFANGALPPAESREPDVVRPRLDLLRQAINRKDRWYLVLHQLYCRYSIDPSTLHQIKAPEAGMHLLVSLLEDNKIMHDGATFGFANFPASAQQLMQTPWYFQTLPSIPVFLSRLDGEWHGIWLRASHPPLVADLWTKLQLPSPILMSVMFMCVARRLHHETYIKPLLNLFWQDLESFKQCIDGLRSNTAQSALHQKLLQEYVKFPRLSDSTSQILPSPHTVHPRSQVETMSRASSGTASAYRSSNGTSQAPNVPAVSPVSQPFGQYTLNSSQCQVTGLVACYRNFVPNSPQLQNPPQYPYYNPMPQGQGQGHGQWHPMHPQMQQLQRQRALMQGHPSRMHPTPQIPHGQRMQRQANMPTVLTAPINSYPQSAPAAVDSPRSAQPPHNPSPMSTISTTPNHITQHPIPQRPHSRLSRQNSTTSQPSASPVTRARPQGQTFQHPPRSHLLPPPGYRAPMTVNPNPMRLGLHLADLRDPMKRLVRQGPDNKEIDTELFFYLNSFVVQPTVIDTDESIYNWNFSLTKDERQKFPTIVQGERVGAQPGPLCLVVKHTVSSRAWSIMVTSWPSVFYVTVNGKELYVRRKVHNGKDLPLDITEYLRVGENSVRVDLLFGQDECKTFKYAFGVEVMEAAGFDKVLSLVQSVPAAESRAAIQKRLTPTIDDDELAVVTDNLTIGLVDPFMARIFNVPARSRNCSHHECFDRDTFIETRKSISSQAPMIDNWRCPICKTDARPQYLVVDQFLVEVHAELARTNRLDTAKAIQIKADGTWTLKIDPDESSPGAENHPSSSSTGLKRKADSPSGSSGPSKSRAKSENSGPSRNLVARIQEPAVIELD